MPHYYLATTQDGRIVSRKSNRPDFTHAATGADGAKSWGLPNFSTSAAAAAALFNGSYRNSAPTCEVVELRKVDAAEFRKATAGINPRTGRAK